MVTQSKKAQATNTIYVFLLAFVGVAVALIVGLMALAELQTAASPDNYYITAAAATALKALTSVSDTTYSSIAFTADQTFTALTKVTIAADKKINITERIINIPGADYLYNISYRGYNTSTSIPFAEFALYNGSTQVAAEEYAIQNVSSMIQVKFLLANYTDHNLTLRYNRTFTGADDLKTNTNICRLASCTLYQTAGGSTYGEAWTFRVQGAVNTGELAGNNWNITFTNTTRTLTTSLTTAGNATGSVTTKLASMPTWLGIILVVAFAFFVLMFFTRLRPEY